MLAGLGDKLSSSRLPADCIVEPWWPPECIGELAALKSEECLPDVFEELFFLKKDDCLLVTLTAWVP